MTDIYTKTPEEKLAQATSMFGKNPAAVQAGIAQNMTNSPTFQDTLSSQQNSVNAMQELANYDKQLAQQYQTGAQQAITNLQAKNQELSNYASGGADPNVIINKASQPAPAIDYTTNGFLSPFVASKLATGQQQANYDVFNMAANTRKSLEAAIGSEARAYADALKYLLDQEQQQAEKDRLKKESEDQLAKEKFARELELVKMTGGSIYNPYDGKTYVIPVPKTAKEGTFDIKTALEELRTANGTFDINTALDNIRTTDRPPLSSFDLPDTLINSSPNADTSATLVKPFVMQGQKLSGNGGGAG